MLTMHDAKAVVSRIEFRTNLMREGADVISLAIMVECCSMAGRWLGMIYRPSLTPNEVRAMDLETWPELEAPEQFLRGLFDEAWESADGEGAAALAAKFGMTSSLRAVIENAASDFAQDCDFMTEEGDDELTKRLRHFATRLQPSCAAPVVSLDAWTGPSTRLIKTDPRPFSAGPAEPTTEAA